MLLYTYPENFRAYKALIAAQFSGANLKIAPGFTFNETNKSEAFLKKFPLGKVSIPIIQCLLHHISRLNSQFPIEKRHFEVITSIVFIFDSVCDDVVSYFWVHKEKRKKSADAEVVCLE